MLNDLTGKVVRFNSRTGNVFWEGDLAVCLNGPSKLFLGLSGDNFGVCWYESGSYDVIGDSKFEVDSVMVNERLRYLSGTEYKASVVDENTNSQIEEDPRHSCIKTDDFVTVIGEVADEEAIRSFLEASKEAGFSH